MRKPSSFLWIPVVFAAACVDRGDVGTFGADGAPDPRPDGGPAAVGAAPEGGEEATSAIMVTPSSSPLAAGGLSTCGIDANGGAVCWGDNQHGALGVGSFVPMTSAQPLAVEGLTKGVRSVAGGVFAACAILVDGTARCWGDSLFGDIDGTTSSVAMPMPHDKTGLSNDVARIGFGTSFACALTIRGRGKCWGIGGGGQLGTGATTDQYIAGDVATKEPLVDIAASMGGLFACAVTSGGKVLCWGQNSSGQLGSNGTTDRPLPDAVTGLDAAAVSVACGREYACARLVDGGVACWGSDAKGQLGRGSAGPAKANPPTRIAGVSGATAIAAGAEHACALAGGQVVCWGSNGMTQIGVGAPLLGVTNFVPASVGAVAVTAGLDHTCVMGPQRAVRCAGDGSRRQTGTGTFSL